MLCLLLVGCMDLGEARSVVVSSSVRNSSWAKLAYSDDAGSVLLIFVDMFCGAMLAGGKGGGSGIECAGVETTAEIVVVEKPSRTVYWIDTGGAVCV